MGFLIEKDYKKQIRSEIKTAIGGDDTYTLDDAENFAQGLMTSYLSIRHDVAKVFIDVIQWDNQDTYNVDEHVWLEDAGTVKVYFALQAGSGNNPLAPGSTFWHPGDKRNKLIKTYMVDIVLYDLHTNLAKNQVPELRQDRYEDAMDWLKGIRDGKLEDPTLPKRVDTDNLPTDVVIRTGNSGKMNPYY